VITFDRVWKFYSEKTPAVCDLSLKVNDGEILVLLGTSGSGKTTTMKMVNRLIEPTRGRISIDEADVAFQDPIQLRRKIGYSIQHIGLFPHMTAEENIAVVPKLLKWPGERIEKRVDLLLTMVGLEADLVKDRYPAQLSGGQKQRVGFARALAADPPTVLMDEPFGALDPITREQLQSEFIELQANMKKTIIFVTHDVFEAAKIGDRVAVLDKGRLQQVDTPARLVENPANEFVGQFLGQHRFQLSLLTRAIKTFLTEAGRARRETEASLGLPRLRAGNSIIEALDTFKKSKAKSLSVYDGEHYVGQLERNQLLESISQLIGQETEGA
jgi:osmoprotectant transport system ATP-binding protein